MIKEKIKSIKEEKREDVEMIRFFECIGGIFINLL